MSTDQNALARFVAALARGDHAAAVTCFSQDGVLEVRRPGENLRLQGPEEITAGLAVVGDAFSQLRYHPSRRYVTPTQLIDESHITAHHVGAFAGADPTGDKVRLAVRLVATAAPDGTLDHLTVWADLPSLWLQLGVQPGWGAAASVVRGVREQRAEHLKVIQGSERVATVVAAPPPPTVETPPAERSTPPPPGRRWFKPALLGVMLFVLAGSAAVVLPGLGQAGTHRPQATGPSGEATSAPPSTDSTPTPSQTPSASPTTGALPQVSSVPESVAPTVQPGVQVVLGTDVLFDFDSAVLQPQAQSAITDLASRVRSAGVTGTIQLNGYTDNQGTDAHNLVLSQARALAVADALSQALAGVAVQLVPQGFGSADPVADNGTDAGRAANRRVTVVLPNSK